MYWINIKILFKTKNFDWFFQKSKCVVADAKYLVWKLGALGVYKNKHHLYIFNHFLIFNLAFECILILIARIEISILGITVSKITHLKDVQITAFFWINKFLV